MNRDKPLIIVLSRNYSTGLGIIRSLGVAGYTVDLIASVKKKGSSVIASGSKYVRNTIEVFSPRIQDDTGDKLIDVLMEYAENQYDKAVLFPTDDFTTLVIDSNRDKLREHFIMPEIISSSDKTINDLMNKTVQSRIARECGLKTPLEWIVPIDGEVKIPKDIVYPCFVKPLTSNSGHKTEMAICESEEKLLEHLYRMKSFFSDRAVLIQEFLKIDKEYDLAGVCLDQEVILPAIIEKTNIAGFERGVGMTGKVLPADVLGDTVEKIKNMLRKFHYVGMFDIDINMCGEDIYFSEVNLRSGGLNFAYFLGGLNLPDIYVKKVTQRLEKLAGKEGVKEDDPNIQEIKTGHTFVYEKVAWEDYINKYISRRELRKILKEADYTLLGTDIDPVPGKIFNKRIRLSLIKNRIIGLLGKRKNTAPSESIENSADKMFTADIIVTGRNYCNILTMARALNKAGYSVEVLRIFKTRPSKLNALRWMRPEAYSKHVSGYREIIANNNPYEVISLLKQCASTEKKQLLVPVDDYLVGILDYYLDDLKNFYHMPSINGIPREINRLMDKKEQKALADKCGLPVLNSVLIKSVKGEFAIPSNISYPCFIKPNISMNSTKAGMAKCDDYNQLNKTLTGMAGKENFEILVEDFVDIKAEYSLLGISLLGKVHSPCLLKAIEGGHKERKGVAMVGETISCDGFENIISRCNSFVEALGYQGIFDVDLIETKDGSIYFIEINFRAGASMYAFTKAGVNLPGMMADAFFKGIPVNTENIVSQTGKKFVSEKILMEEFARGDVNINKIKRVMRDADICFVKDKEDIKPYKYFRRFYIIAAVMQIVFRGRR